MRISFVCALPGWVRSVLTGGVVLAATALPAMAGLDEIQVAPGSADYNKIAAITGTQVEPGYVATVGRNGAMGFRLPDGSVFVIGDLHSTRTDVTGIELTRYTPAADGQSAVVEVTLSEGNLAIDNTQAPGTRIIVRTPDSVVEMAPGGHVACVTAMPPTGRKPRRTLAAVRDGSVTFRNANGTPPQRITSRRSIASNSRTGAPRPITHPYNDCCGLLEPLRRQALNAAPGILPPQGPVAVYSPPVAAPPVATIPAAVPGGVATGPLGGIPAGAVIAGGVGAAALGGALFGILSGGDDGATTTTATTTTSN